MLRRALRLASASAAVLAVAACVSQPKPPGPAAPGTSAASSAPPTLDGATVPAISVESSAPQPAVATYSCADGGRVTIRNVGSSVRVLGQDGVEEELPASPAGQSSRFGVAHDAIVIEGREALVMRGGASPLACRR